MHTQPRIHVIVQLFKEELMEMFHGLMQFTTSSYIKNEAHDCYIQISNHTYMQIEPVITEHEAIFDS